MGIEDGNDIGNFDISEWISNNLGTLGDLGSSLGSIGAPLAGATQDSYQPNFSSALDATSSPAMASMMNLSEMFPGYAPEQPAGPSFWQQANDFYAPIERTVSSPLGKLGIGALGALASAYGANRQNKNYKQAVQEALAAKAAARAQHMTDTAPMRVTNQRAAAPSWGANQRRAFSGNSLAAMTPRSSGTMYAAEGGGVSGHGGLCQACAARQNYVEGGTAGQDDKIPAMLSDGEYIVDADVVSALGDGNNAAGAKKLDKMRVGIRTHKRSASPNKIPPKAKKPEAYLKGAK